MSISEQIETQKSTLIEQYISAYKSTGTGLSKALKLMHKDIQKMRDDKLTLSEQIDILNGIFNISIKYDTYKKWSARHFRKELKKIKNSTPQNRKKTSFRLNEMKDKKVAPVEPTNNKSVKEIFKKTITHKSDLEDYL